MIRLPLLLSVYICLNTYSGIKTISENSKNKLLPCDIAKSITVNLIADKDFSGSAIIIHRSKQKYTVLTNSHLLPDNRKIYKIKTPDGKTHLATVISNAKRLLKKTNNTSKLKVKVKNQFIDDSSNEYDDLALLQFSSKSQYSIAQISSKQDILRSKSIVYAAGFPVKQEELNHSKNDLNFTCDNKGGEISFILDRPMQSGYQIGYFITIAKGMSGGALVNNQGKLVGINGRHNHPFIPNYAYKDGKTVEHSLDLLNKSSWAISIETIEKFIGQRSPTIKLNRSKSSSNPIYPTLPSPKPTVTPSPLPTLPSSKPTIIPSPLPTLPSPKPTVTPSQKK